MNCAESRQNSLVQQIEPVLRVTTSGGGVFDDPSEDALFMLFDDITGGDVAFFIVERLDDASGQTFAQTIRDDDGVWIVERREGSPNAHFRAGFPDIGSAHAAITHWAYGQQAVDQSVWEQIPPG